MDIHTLFCALQRMYQEIFLNTTHQVKAITIGIIKADPLAKLVIAYLLFAPHTSFPYLSHSTLQDPFSYTYLYMALYLS